MKFALVNGAKYLPEPSKMGNCPYCNAEVVSKCGNIKIWHWAHKGRLLCDPWWENETEWHRNWKGQFPIDWQEVIHYADCGEKHIADVKTNQEWVLEFQHSFLNPNERRSRNEFYKNLFWVVDGKRLKRDEEKIMRAFQNGIPFGFTRKILKEHNSLLKVWHSNHAVAFDFGTSEMLILLPKCFDDVLYTCLVKKEDLIEIFNIENSKKSQEFKNLIINFPNIILNNAIQIQRQNQQREAMRSYQIIYGNRARYRARRHFRL